MALPGNTNIFRLDGRTALVTGATAGLGFAMARGLSEAGAKVILHGRDQQRTAAAALAVPGAFPLVFDLDDSDATERGLAGCIGAVGAIDILVCNAGIRDRRPFLETSRKRFSEVLQTNLVGHFHLAQLVTKSMPTRGGNIVFVSSIAAGRSPARGSTYASSKAALESLTRSLAVELGSHCIRVNAISPGYFATDANSGLVNEPSVVEVVKSRIPLQRWAQPAEIVGGLIFLVSDAATYVTGHTLVIDGGMSVAG